MSTKSPKFAKIPSKPFFMPSLVKDEGLILPPDLKALRDEDYIKKGIEAEKQQKEKRREAFNEALLAFANDSSIEEAYKDIRFLNKSVCIRIFVFEERQETSLDTGDLENPNAIVYKEVTSYAKVVGIGETSDFKGVLNVGDIVTIQDLMMQTTQNPEWEQAHKIWISSNKTPESIDPKTLPRYVPTVTMMWDRYNYCLNKIYPTPEDLFTFYIPESFIISVPNIK